MRPRSLLLLILLLFSGCGMATAPVTPMPATPTPPQTPQPPTAPPAAEGPGRLYVLSTVLDSAPRLARLAAYDPVSGDHFFSRVFTATNYPLRMLTNPLGTTLYAVNQHDLHVISAEDGAERWQHRLIDTPPEDLGAWFIPIAVQEETAQLFLLHTHRIAFMEFRTDLVVFDLAARQWSPGKPLGPCDLYAIAGTMLACAQNERQTSFEQTPPGHVQLVELTTGMVVNTQVLSGGIGAIALHPQSHDLWVAPPRAPTPISAYDQLQPRPLNLLVIDGADGAIREVRVAPPDSGLGIEVPNLSFDPAGTTLRIVQDQEAGKVIVRVLRTDSLQEQSAFQLTTPRLSISQMARDNSLWFGMIWQWDGLLRVQADGQQLPDLPLPGDDIQAIQLAPAPPTTSVAEAIPTPHPTPRLGSGHFPDPPDWLNAPAAIVEWLNDSPANPPRIRELVAEWRTILQTLAPGGGAGGYYSENTTDEIQLADLNADGQDEIIISMFANRPPSHRQPGPPVQHLMVFSQDQGRYSVVAHTTTTEGMEKSLLMPTFLWNIADITGDGQAEIITDSGHCGAHTCFGYPDIWQWSAGGLRSILSSTIYTPSHDLEPNIAHSFAEYRLVDANDDGVQEFQLEGGGVGSVGGCCQRRTLSTFVWDGAAYRFDRVEYVPDESEPFWALIDAARLFRDGDYAAAYAGYEAILAAPKADTEGAIPYTQVARVSRFQLMVTAIVLGRQDAAEQWRSELVATGDQAWSDAFWQRYQATGSIQEACVSATPIAQTLEFPHTGYVSWHADRVTCVFR